VEAGLKQSIDAEMEATLEVLFSDL
jgi:hypothetical protein